MTLRELGEDRLLAKLLRPGPRQPGVIVGPGDDCAIVEAARGGKLMLLKTDCVVEGIHFTRTARAADVGWKAMARPLSDIAAMSGVPRFALITMILSPEVTVAWAAALNRGLRRAAAGYDVAVVGGETSSTRGPATITVAIAGEVERGRRVLRSGGRARDPLFVTGKLGGSIRGHHLRFRPRVLEARWLTEHFRIHAMMDLSDGLGADLPRLAAASELGYQLEQRAVPRNRGCSIQQAINDGEDYELLFAVAPQAADELERRWAERWTLKLTRIGLLTAARNPKTVAPSGYDHFKQR
ncbi:MAG: thiamine-phosphate kinase [Verrucomicrobiota bacterium]|nr:thiamine-phosphate kinase [Verrucomicrobiota bacterium]